MSEDASVGTCPICLEEIADVNEAFVEECLHHYCFQVRALVLCARFLPVLSFEVRHFIPWYLIYSVLPRGCGLNESEALR